MPENYVSEGRLVKLENATAASNIAAGAQVAVNTAANTVYSFSRDTTGLATAGSFGARFLGVLDEDVSAGQDNFSIWTHGVFTWQIASGQTSVDGFVGVPVFGEASGGGFLVTTLTGGLNITGSLPIGTIVGQQYQGAAGSGCWVLVKINPGAFRWGGFSAATGTGQGDCFPPIN